jgi:arginine/lysine/ornithine decarboxylase
MVEKAITDMEEVPAAVYITSPDYLGGQADIAGIANVCHRLGTILAVDNAHGAYGHFLEKPIHPMDLGADICCDSAHKTLPVLTGGAYLHISKAAPESFDRNAKQAMVLFGSTSPSYLTLSSLDLCNSYLGETYRERLAHTVEMVQQAKKKLREHGWCVEESEVLKITIKAPDQVSAVQIAEKLRKENIECEYADDKYMVCMISPENEDEDLERLVSSLGRNLYGTSTDISMTVLRTEQRMSIREAIFAERESIAVEKAEGRICGAPVVSCPPAIPIVVSGEQISSEAIEMFQYYGISEVEVIKN